MSLGVGDSLIFNQSNIGVGVVTKISPLLNYNVWIVYSIYDRPMARQLELLRKSVENGEVEISRGK